MKKRSVPIALLSCILVLAGLGAYLVPTTTEATPTRVLMENSGGRIVFTHAAHSMPGQYGDIACAVCHHDINITLPSGKAGKSPAGAAGKNATGVAGAAQPAVMPCSSCHGAAETPGFVAAHQEKYRAQGGEASCVACHHTRFTGFSSAWDHETHKTYASDDCTTCHHPADFEYKPGKTMEHKPQKCSNCHTTRPNPLASTTLKNATHTRCEPCHAGFFEEKTKGCDNCHSRVSTASDLAKKGDSAASGAPAVPPSVTYAPCSSCHAPIPARMDAFHKNCMGCHDKAGKGPGSKAECKTCHRS